jgi:carbamate kinase
MQKFEVPLQVVIELGLNNIQQKYLNSKLNLNQDTLMIYTAEALMDIVATTVTLGVSHSRVPTIGS